jgi:amino acid adenylation domain-containing protein
MLKISEARGAARDDFLEHTVQALFERQVQRTPSTIALQDEQQQLSYAALNACANALCARIRAQLRDGAPAPIGLLLDRSAEMVIAMLACMKAGSHYVPLDPELPDERLALLSARARCRLVLAGRGHAARAARLGGAVNAIVDCSACADPAAAVPDPGIAVDPSALIYVMFTSGSTGAPKGVMVTHRSVANRLLWMIGEGLITADDRVLQRTPFAFDASVWEIFTPLLTGARLCLAPPNAHRDPASHVAAIRRWDITVLQTVPSFLALLAAEPGIEACRSLRRVFFGGESAPAALLRALRGKLDAEPYNLYGPTETCIDVTCWPCAAESAPDGTLPIGRPNANVVVRIVDARLRPVPPGETGEILVSGPCVAQGYLGDAALTAERFLSISFGEGPERTYRTGDYGRMRPDGVIEFLGRADSQIKIAGQRIEPAEIENVLAAHPGVLQAAVCARSARSRVRLSAFVVPRRGAALAEADLISYLSARLPRAMVPAEVFITDSVPRSASGKVDVSRLAELAAAPLRPPAPLYGDEIEQKLGAVWTEVLELPSIDRADNLLNRGADSLSMVLAAESIEKVFGVPVSVEQLFAASTIALQAQLVSEALSARHQRMTSV